MPFADAVPRYIYEGFLPQKITLAEAVTCGDLLGYSAGWKKADANAAIEALLVAGEDGDNAEEITAYPMARIGNYTGGTAGTVMYLSDTAGSISEAASPTAKQRVGVMLSATECFIRPELPGDKKFSINLIIDIAGTAVDAHFYQATQKCKVTDIWACPIVAGTDAGAVTATVRKCTGIQAPSAGADLLGATKVDLKGTVNTLQDPALTATVADLVLAIGNRLAVDVTGVLTAVVCVVTVELENVV